MEHVSAMRKLRCLNGQVWRECLSSKLLRRFKAAYICMSLTLDSVFLFSLRSPPALNHYSYFNP